ncbi:uncharacterized protein H6S33_005610 [Morchella sextelata]|uniref:uncharacterized protein n=1 Tax=Morchella sextelata TaxID=1174677 RepID=UPI001D056CDE|nr:uncharacterized protein H6S33_005610 [Morchella sextelata]KAH0613724.1 hypothetical protein H6S33_005610 [Morchella sextelata]
MKFPNRVHRSAHTAELAGSTPYTLPYAHTPWTAEEFSAIRQPQIPTTAKQARQLFTKLLDIVCTGRLSRLLLYDTMMIRQISIDLNITSKLYWWYRYDGPLPGRNPTETPTRGFGKDEALFPHSSVH